MFYRIIFLIFYLLLVVSCNFHRFAVCFQSFMNIACRNTAARIKRFLRLHIVIKLSIKNKHNKFFIMLQRNSFSISLQMWRLSKIGILEIFLTVSLKTHASRGGGRGRDEVWDRETMFSQLAKRSPCVVVSG